MEQEKTQILELISYNRQDYEKTDGLPADELCLRINEDRVNWINLDRLYDQDTIDKLQHHFKLHSLLVEDVVSDQRPKAEEFDEFP